MNDEEIASKIVKSGVGMRVDDQGNYSLGPTFHYKDRYLSAKEFIDDWRVTGKLIELVGDVSIQTVNAVSKVVCEHGDRMLSNKPANGLNRAIAIAVLEAVERFDTAVTQKQMPTLSLALPDDDDDDTVVHNITVLTDDG